MFNEIHWNNHSSCPDQWSIFQPQAPIRLVRVWLFATLSNFKAGVSLATIPGKWNGALWLDFRGLLVMECGSISSRGAPGWKSLPVYYLQCNLVIMFSYLVVFTSTYACKYFIFFFFYFYALKVATQSYTPSTRRLLTPRKSKRSLLVSWRRISWVWMHYPRHSGGRGRSVNFINNWCSSFNGCTPLADVTAWVLVNANVVWRNIQSKAP